MDLTHPGIVRLYHFEPAHGTQPPYLVMEYLPWQTGERWMAFAGEGGVPPKAALGVGLSACDALSYAHDQSVLHLDI